MTRFGLRAFGAWGMPGSVKQPEIPADMLQCPEGQAYVVGVGCQPLVPEELTSCPEGQVYLPGVGCQAPPPTIGGFFTKIPSTPAQPTGFAFTAVCGAGKVKDAQGNCVTPPKPIDYSPYAAMARALAAKQAAAPTLSSTARFAVLPKLRISDLPESSTIDLTKEPHKRPQLELFEGMVRAFALGATVLVLTVGYVIYRATRTPKAVSNRPRSRGGRRSGRGRKRHLSYGPR
jgi:hypothetical protein